tara:strand:+ start:59 stop:346 length:288 start_codon:yes stop_codon:yes gene_type:complete
MIAAQLGNVNKTFPVLVIILTDFTEQQLTHCRWFFVITINLACTSVLNKTYLNPNGFIAQFPLALESCGVVELWSCGYHQPIALLLTAVKVLELK